MEFVRSFSLKSGVWIVTSRRYIMQIDSSAKSVLQHTHDRKIWISMSKREYIGSMSIAQRVRWLSSLIPRMKETGIATNMECLINVSHWKMLNSLRGGEFIAMGTFKEAILQIVLAKHASL